MEIGRQNVNVKGRIDKKCYECSKFGYFARNCWERKKKAGKCYNCGKEGHIARNCSQPKKVMVRAVEIAPQEEKKDFGEGSE